MYRLIIIFFGLLQASLTHANSDERLDYFLSLDLEELVNIEASIATNMKQTITKAPAVVTVITAEDIKATGATNLVDVLEGVPGIHVRASHFGFRPLIHFRGAKATQTLLMINNTPMKDLMWGFGIFWKGLPVNMIERVEIIRGPGSALFGSDASAGVVNVITKTAGKIEDTEAGVRIGSYHTRSAWMQYGENWNGFDIGLTANLYHTNGHNPYIEADGQTMQDLSFDPDVSLVPGHAQYGWQNEDLRLSIAKGYWRLHTDYVRQTDLEIGLTGGGVLDPVTHASSSRYNIDLFYDNDAFRKDWALDMALRYQHLDYTSGDGFQEHPPGYTDNTGVYSNGLINQMRSAERRLNFELSGLYTGIKAHTIHLGAGYTWQDLYFVEQFINFGTGPNGVDLPADGPLVDVSDTTYAFAPEKTRKIGHLFLQDVWSISDVWELTAGVRYDHYSDFGGTLNPRLALVWQATNKLTTKLMYSQAFRAPSYQELFAETSRTLPNSNLKPEQSQTIDLAFSYAATRYLHLNLNLFHFKHTDIIKAIPVSGLAKIQFQNTGDHDIYGTELEARWQAMRGLRISANYSWRHQDDSSFRAVQEPDQDAYLRADWAFLPNWNWNIQANWIGERPRPSDDGRPQVDDHLITDTTIRYADIKNWEFAASVRNLFDKDAREYTGKAIPNDLPLPGRNLYVEMRYRF